MSSYFSKKNIIRVLYFILGIFLFSFSFNFFLLPNNLVFGGVSGLSIIFHKVFDINTSLFVFIVNMALLFISFPILGKKKSLATICGSILLPIIMELTSLLTPYIVFDEMELFMSVLVGGIVAGTGVGLVYRSGFTTGGTDIINQIIHKYLKLSMGKAMLITDGLIVTSSIFVFGVTKFLYAIVVLYIMTVMTDRVILGVGKSKAFYIVTEKTQEVKKYIIDTLGHGVTVFDAVGGYSKENQKVIFCVIPTRDYFYLKEGISKIDEDSFFVVTDAYEVSGGEYKQ